LHVGHQPPLETAPESVLQLGDLLGRSVAGDDDLLLGVVERVEGVEELLLCSFRPLQELDVVDEQDVRLAVGALELGDAVVVGSR
jgi:hypothetical protein